METEAIKICDDGRMHLSGHVYRRMRWFEKLRLYVFRKRYTKALGKLNRAISDKDIRRACKYEELMYECDNRVEDYIHEMSMKYVVRDSRAWSAARTGGTATPRGRGTISPPS